MPKQAHSIETYQARRDFSVTAEPAPASGTSRGTAKAPIFVVQKHQAHRAGLHYDFRLEHSGVLWSWAVRKGPSLDPSDKRIAVHVEDHPLDYAAFQGAIPEGQYGAGTVETWDRGTWQPLIDPDAGLRDGEIKFVLDGSRLHGKFTLVRLKPKPNQRNRQDNWLLIKGHDAEERAGADAKALEDTPLPTAAPGGAKARPSLDIPGAVKAALPAKQAPALASVADEPPSTDGWLTEVKFDGYRLLAFLDHGKVRLLTRNGNDWTDRLPAVARAVGRVAADSALLDGELVALDKDGVSSFPLLQAALSDGRDATLTFYLFDLLHLDGWDLRKAALRDRKERLRTLDPWRGMLRFSDHHEGDAARMRQAACRMKLEGIVCKNGASPYRAGRGRDWVKVKCIGREELLVLGWTEPAGSRTGLGALHLGYYDPDGALHYAGGVGTGLSDDMLAVLRDRLDGLHSAPPKDLRIAGEDPPRGIHWVQPVLIAEVSFTGWSGSGRVRHAVFLGLREDKAPREVVRAVADPDAERRGVDARGFAPGVRRKKPAVAIPPVASTPVRTGSRIVTAKAPRDRAETYEGIRLTHPDRELWPGISKRDLVTYWRTVAGQALPWIAGRPLAILRCPEGVDGEHFFQKHAHGTMPEGVREGSADKAPYLAIDGLQGLVAMAQMSAVELHGWGATEAHPARPDQLVFDLDPGEGVTVPDIVAAALDVRAKLEAIGLPSFCRTSGGKGLHVVVPLPPERDWDFVRPFCRKFAESLSALAPDKYLAKVRIADRRGRILIDWLRNGLGSTSVASFSPRARAGAGVATPLAWREVTPKLDLAAFTVRSVPGRLQRLKHDPWEEFDRKRTRLPLVT